MEIFAVSFIVFLVACVALAIGQFFGRGPIHGSCRPQGSSGGCADLEMCALRRASGECQKRGA